MLKLAIFLPCAESNVMIAISDQNFDSESIRPPTAGRLSSGGLPPLPRLRRARGFVAPSDI